MKSNSLTIQQGVPQGSVLGPILFSIFLNDIFNCTSFNTFSFADDTTCMASSDNIQELYRVVNTNLSELYDWLCANRLKLNAQKTKYVLFTNKKLVTIPVIKINDHIIEKVDKIKVLGVTIDEKLTFKYHIHEINRKLAYTSHLIKRLSFLKVNTLRMVYYAYGYSALTYANTIWGNSAKSHLNLIQVTQNRLIRILWGNHEIKTCEMFSKLRILNIHQINNFSINCLMFKIMNNLAPKSLIDIINKYQYSTKKTYNTRKYFIYRPQFTLAISCRCFAWIGPQIWNNLPNHIRNADSQKSFRRLLLETYFINLRQ